MKYINMNLTKSVLRDFFNRCPCFSSFLVCTDVHALADDESYDDYLDDSADDDDDNDDEFS